MAVLGNVIERVKKASLVDDVIVATPLTPNDLEKLTPICREHGVPMFSGSELDVLNRYYTCADETDCDTIVRITSDCPLIDPDVIDGTINYYMMRSYQYVANRYKRPAFPDGQDVEVFSFAILTEADRRARKDEREHVTTWIKNRLPHLCSAYHSKKDLHDVRMTLDTEEDYKRLKWICKTLKRKHGDRIWNLNEIMEVMGGRNNS